MCMMSLGLNLKYNAVLVVILLALITLWSVPLTIS